MGDFLPLTNIHYHYDLLKPSLLFKIIGKVCKKFKITLYTYSLNSLVSFNMSEFPVSEKTIEKKLRLLLATKMHYIKINKPL